MGIRLAFGRPCAAFLLCTVGQLAAAQVNVTTYHNDIARTGQNTNETILTPANVNSTQFGKLFSVTVDGAVYAQPLYLSSVSIGGGTHNVVYVVTEHDSVYAIDADSGTVYSKVSLIPAGGTTVNSSDDLGCGDLVPEVGITGTPVIDPSGGTLYVVAAAKVNGNIVQYLHALSVTGLAEKFNGPVKIQASVAGNDNYGSGGTITFNPKQENQRPALLLENGHVLIGWASHCDFDPWHGWLMSYNAGTLAQEAAFVVSPNGERSGIWMSGGGLAADAEGNVYFSTGNGTWNGTTDYGDSILKLGPPVNNSFPVVDYFTPYNQATLYTNDDDVSAGGVVLLPTLPSGQQLLAQQGKQATIYLLNTAKMGKYCPNLNPPCSGKDTQIVQEIQNASAGIWGSPAYWNGNLYWTGNGGSIKAWSFNANGSGLISTSPTSKSAQTFAFSAPTPAISSNGTTNGILWALDGSADDSTCDGGGSSCLGLYAYDATNLANLLYNSSQAANNRDSPGTALKFETPIIANGKVYVGTVGRVTAYGLLNGGTPVAASPSFTPQPGPYAAAVNVTLGDTTPGTVIYYTTNGSTPSAASTKYTTAVPVASTETLQAIAIAPGYSSSPVSSGTYTIGATTAGAPISLTTVANVAGTVPDGTPTTKGGWDNDGNSYSSTLLGSSITYGGSTFALGTSGVDAVSSTTIPLPAGSYGTLQLLGSAVNGNQTNQPFIVTYTDGTTSTFTQSLSDWWWPAQTFAGETRVLHMAYNDSSTGAKNSGSVYLYGYSFTLNSAKTLKSLTLPNNRNVVILAVDVANPASGGGTPVATGPQFTPAPGPYTGSVNVTLTDSTPGAVIYYTTNGAPPTAASTKYTAAIPVASTETLQAVAVAPGYTNSAVTSGTYTITAGGGTTGGGAVALTAVANVAGTVPDGTPTTKGGWDNDGNSYSSTLLGSSITYGGSTFALGVSGVDAVSSTTIPLPAGSYGTLQLLGSAVNGNQTNQPFIVTYTDGTTSTFTQSLSDWWWPAQTFAGETRVLHMAYNDSSTGAKNSGSVYLYGYSFTLNSAKTLKSLTLPNNRNVIVLAVDVANPASGGTGGTGGGTAPVVNDPTGFTSAAGFSLVGATVTGGTLQVTDGGYTEGKAVWTSTPVNVQKFTTDFSFMMSPAGANTADGLTFAMQNAGATAVGQTGGGLGYAGIASSVAIKFDLYNNSGEGTDSTGIYTAGAYPSVPSVDMTSSGVNLHSGDTMHAHVVYDGTTLTLTLTDTVTKAVFTTSQAINIPTTVGGNTAYVGFTGGTGGLTIQQQILNWTYTVN
jgi:hypothetical protein